jgi:hypothetical protein
VLLSFALEMISVEVLFFLDTLRASVARPPVDTAPATISPTDAKQNGHIVGHLSVAKPER